jgi:hypothetical protein
MSSFQLVQITTGQLAWTGWDLSGTAANLGADVEVQELEAVGHAEGGELAHNGDDLARPQPELGLLARSGPPVALVARGQLRAHSQHRPHPHPPRHSQQHPQLLTHNKRT